MLSTLVHYRIKLCLANAAWVLIAVDMASVRVKRVDGTQRLGTQTEMAGLSKD